MESHWRTLTKTLSWRVIAVTVTVVISYAWLDDLKSSLAIGLGANSLKLLVYYFHERLWNAVSWGRRPWATPAEEVHPSSPDASLNSVGHPAVEAG